MIGTMHILLHETMDGVGGFHMKAHIQSMGLIGTGEVTGDKYQATGVTRDILNGKVGENYTLVNNHRLIGPSVNNLLVHEVYRYMVNADGELVLEFDHWSMTCK